MIRRALLLVALAGCGDTTTPVPDAATDGASADAPPGFPTTCDGACRTTALTATFGAATRTLDRAFFGITTSAGGTTLHVEAYRGGGTTCPTETSPAPDYTLVLGRVPVPTSTQPVTSPANILDFEGDLLGGQLGAAAMSVAITPVAADVAGADAMIALDVMLTFEVGAITGHLFATHCDSLDAAE